MDVIIKVKKYKAGGGSKKGRQSGHNERIGRYKKQALRTAANKARRIAKAAAMKRG